MKTSLKILLSTLLLSASMATYAQVNYEFNELGSAIHHNKIETVKSLLESGTSPNEMQNVTTPLGIATDRNHVEIIELLLAQPSIEINTPFDIQYLGAGYENAMTKNALLCAVDNFNIEVANTLLDRGAIADFVFHNQRTDAGETRGVTLMNCLFIPFSDDALALAQRIADNTVEINREFKFVNQSIQTLLYRLLYSDNCIPYNSVVKSLIDRGAKYKDYYEPDSSAIEVFKQYASAAEVKAYENNQKYLYTSCSLAAALRGNSEMLEYMLDKGAAIDRYDDKGAILMLSCTSASCVEVLMKRGVDVNVGHPISGWPLIFTAVKLENDLLEGILQLGADPNIVVNGVSVKNLVNSCSSKQKKAATKILQKYGCTVL